MNHGDLEPALERLLAETPSSLDTERLRADIAVATSRQRQRPPWLSSITEPSMRYRSQLVAGSPSLRLTAVIGIAAALLLALAGAIVAGASVLPRPPVAPRNGPIAMVGTDGDRGVIWLVAPDGAGAHPLDAGGGAEGGPHWSPDGDRIAFWRFGDSTVDLVVANPGGSQEWTLPAPDGFVLAPAESSCSTPIAWSLDGRGLAVGVIRAGETRYLSSMGIGKGPHPLSIAVYDVATRTGRVLDPGVLVWGTRLWPLADGSIGFLGQDPASITPKGGDVISLAGKSDLLAIDPVSGSTRTLAAGTGDLVCDDSTTDVRSDGTAAVLVRPAGPGSNGTASLVVLPLAGDGAAATLVTAEQPAYLCCPRLSPDGRRVAFSEGSDQGGDTGVQRLLVADLADRTIDRLPGQVFGPVTWSPDGSRLLVRLGDPYGAGIVTLADDQVTRITGLEPTVDEPSWQTAPE
jgi:hypothetical protein